MHVGRLFLITYIHFEPHKQICGPALSSWATPMTQKALAY